MDQLNLLKLNIYYIRLVNKKLTYFYCFLNEQHSKYQLIRNKRNLLCSILNKIKKENKSSKSE